MEIYKKINHCRVCDSSEINDFFDMGMLYLTGIFPKKEESNPAASPLCLSLCSNCGLVQLRHSVDPKVMFSGHYGYRSGTNQTMRNHLANIVKAIRKKIELDQKDYVLDIGCNDGTLLACYPEEIKKIGIDPVSEKFFKNFPKNTEILFDFFSSNALKERNIHKKFKVITSISMFYDLEDPVSFCKDIAEHLEPQGLWVFEQSYLPLMLQKNSFDTICHEHLEYYSLTQIKKILSKASLQIIDVSFNSINGGSVQVYASHNYSKIQANQEKIETIIKREALNGILEISTYHAFRERCSSLSRNILVWAKKVRSEGKRIHVYGASTKGNTILQYCGLDHSLIEAASDRNEEKWGCRTPGTNIPVLSEKESRAMNPDYYFVLPWHFKEEFLQRESFFGGHFVFPLPNFEIIEP